MWRLPNLEFFLSKSNKLLLFNFQVRQISKKIEMKPNRQTAPIKNRRFNESTRRRPFPFAPERICPISTFPRSRSTSTRTRTMTRHRLPVAGPTIPLIRSQRTLASRTSPASRMRRGCSAGSGAGCLAPPKGRRRALRSVRLPMWMASTRLTTSRSSLRRRKCVEVGRRGLLLRNGLSSSRCSLRLFFDCMLSWSAKRETFSTKVGRLEDFLVVGLVPFFKEAL